MSDDIEATTPAAPAQPTELRIVERSFAALIDALLPSFAMVGVSLRVSQEDHAAIRSALAGASTGLHLLRQALAAAPAVEGGQPLHEALAAKLSRIDLDLSRVLHEMAGSSSMCWEPQPTGVFDSSAAIGFVESAINEIRAPLREVIAALAASPPPAPAVAPTPITKEWACIP
jgi:hypothetical protein